jgi:glutaredoxin
MTLAPAPSAGQRQRGNADTEQPVVRQAVRSVNWFRSAHNRMAVVVVSTRSCFVCKNAKKKLWRRNLRLEKIPHGDEMPKLRQDSGTNNAIPTEQRTGRAAKMHIMQ